MWKFILQRKQKGSKLEWNICIVIVLQGTFNFQNSQMTLILHLKNFFPILQKSKYFLLEIFTEHFIEKILSGLSVYYKTKMHYFTFFFWSCYRKTQKFFRNGKFITQR